MDNIKIYIEYVSNVVEAVGLITIFVGIIYSLIRFLISLNKNDSNNYINLRHNIGKSILLGLEILIAADIMGTVVTDPTLGSVFVLGIIVIIRTVLSLSLQVELDGKFPWQRSGK